jgi:hypothetical protein
VAVAELEERVRSDPHIPGCRMLTLPSYRRKNTRFTTRRRSCSLGSSSRMDTNSTQTSSRSVSSSRVEEAPNGCTVRKWRCIAHLPPIVVLFVVCTGAFYCYWLPSECRVLFRSDWTRHISMWEKGTEAFTDQSNVEYGIMQSRIITAARVCGAISGQLCRADRCAVRRCLLN